MEPGERESKSLFLEMVIYKFAVLFFFFFRLFFSWPCLCVCLEADGARSGFTRKQRPPLWLRL